MVGITKGGPKPAANAGNDNAAGETEPQAADDPTG
jgi:hypothetical protein